MKYEKSIKKVRLGDMPMPEPKKGEVRIKIKVAGICGTDLHIYYDDIYSTNPPVILGHEVSGIIDSLGEGVEDISVGERVTSETYYYTCGICCYCRTGRNNLCNKRLSIGSGVNGGFAEYLVVPAKNIHRIPSNISFEEAAMTEPLVSCQAHNDAQASVIVKPKAMAISWMMPNLATTGRRLLRFNDARDLTRH